jgi:predicted metalloprotease with PDZ domain
MNLHRLRALAHDPEKLQTFRTRSCAKSKRIAGVVGSTLSKNALAAAGAAVAAGGLALAQTPPAPLPLPPAIVAPRDAPFAGTIRLAVDATDVTRHIFRVTETIPVESGRLTLLYPKWLPGTHSPGGRIDSLAGLMIKAHGRRLEWTRDTLDVYAFHVDVPAGATQLDLEFQFLSAGDGNEGRIVTTPEMLNLQWNSVVLYPAGYFVRQITVEPSVKLPDGWQFATALEPESTPAAPPAAAPAGPSTTFKPVSLETLVDSPMFAGRYVKRVELDGSAPAAVRLNIFADRPDLLQAKPEQLDAHRALVAEAAKLFNSHHYDHYDLLLALTDRMGGIGLEHHRSSENATVPTYFTEWDKNADTRALVPHEYAHSWNGKFRRPADLWTANYDVPMRDSLLWVYEGQTQYLGNVLAARAGLWTRQQALDAFAEVAALYDHRIGREWKSLQDTTNDPITANRRAIPWRSWQRSEDYYSEGELVWLDADTLIREASGGTKSLDDFARAFFGIDNGSWVPETYTFDDVVSTLNAVQPYDWAGFLHARLESHEREAPLDGITRGGYRLVYSDTPSDFFKATETRRKFTDLTFSLGLVVGRDSKLTDVLWDGPGYAAGLTVGTQIVAVDGVTYDGDRLKESVKNAKTNDGTIELLVKNGDRYSTVRINYHEGLRYPHLERAEQGAGPTPRLDQILTPRR